MSENTATSVKEDTFFIKKEDQLTETSRPGRLYRMMVKSDHMEAIIAELDPKAESRWYQHWGEELHLVLQGEMEYVVGEKSYHLAEGDMLWHRSDLKHKAKNNGSKKVIYITVGTPPTFVKSMI